MAGIEESNIDDELTIIKEAGRGEDVRAAIISAIRKIYNVREYPASTKKITHNGTYETDKPWNKVIVDVAEGGASLNIDCVNQAIKDNGWYTIDILKQLGYLDNPNCDGVDGFLIQVDQVPGNFGEKNITENGTYDPLLDGFDGYSKVYVNVLGGERKDYYTVKFYDGNRLLQAVQVPYGANATYSGETPTSGGLFTGWNPNPTAVSRDMNCYAVYAGQGVAGTGEFQETIRDTWQTIATNCKAGNRKYKPGDTKLLKLTGYNNSTFTLNMMLVGYNLDVTVNNKYAASTWINVAYTGNNFKAEPYHLFGRMTLCAPPQTAQLAKMHGHQSWWGNSLARALFNGNPNDIAYDTDPGSDDKSYYDAMAAQHLTLPEVVNKAAGFDMFGQMETVVKYTTDSLYQDGQTYLYTDQVTQDKIWIPSQRELSIPIFNGGTKPIDFCNSGSNYGNPCALGQWIYTANKSYEETGYNQHHLLSRDRRKSGGYLDSAVGFSRMYVLGDLDHSGLYPSKIADIGDSWQCNAVYADSYLPIGFCL